MKIKEFVFNYHDYEYKNQEESAVENIMALTLRNVIFKK